MFESNRESMGAIYRKVSTGSEDEKLVFDPENSNANTPTDWSPDGRFILFQNVNKGTGFDIWAYDLAEERKSAFVVDTNDQRDARFSPDGKWVIYSSNESGRYEIYVRSFPAGGGKWQISGGGGSGPTWRADGKEIFYLAPDGQIMAVDVKTEPGFEAGRPKALFEASTEGLGEQVYDVSADGQRFIVNTSSQSGRGSTTPVTLVTNWKATLKK
jgi:Tol biopolymer transport system component